MAKFSRGVTLGAFILATLLFGNQAQAAANPIVLTSSFDAASKTLQAHYYNTGTSPIMILADIELYGGGVKVGQTFKDQIIIPAGATKDFAMTAPADLPAGNYRFTAAAFAPNWESLLIWSNGAATFSVGNQAVPVLTIDDKGQTWVAIKNTGGDGEVLVDLELYDGQGRLVSQKYFDHETIHSNETKIYRLGQVFLSPGNEPYVLKAGIFKPEWSGLVAWYNEVMKFTIAH